MRALPGVLDCSLNDAGVALLVHPEVDARLLQAKAQAVFAELADPRPLMIMGGLAPKPTQKLAGVIRYDATPLSLTVFAVVVLCLLALIPLAPTNHRGDGADTTSSADTELAVASSLTPELFRPAASYTPRRAASSASTPSFVVVAAAVVTAEPQGEQEPERGPKASPRPAPRRPVAAAQLAPAVTVAACVPGRSAGHRVAAKKPLPASAKGTPCG